MNDKGSLVESIISYDVLLSEKLASSKNLDELETNFALTAFCKDEDRVSCYVFKDGKYELGVEGEKNIWHILLDNIRTLIDEKFHGRCLFLLNFAKKASGISGFSYGMPEWYFNQSHPSKKTFLDGLVSEKVALSDFFLNVGKTPPFFVVCLNCDAEIQKATEDMGIPCLLIKGTLGDIESFHFASCGSFISRYPVFNESIEGICKASAYLFSMKAETTQNCCTRSSGFLTFVPLLFDEQVRTAFQTVVIKDLTCSSIVDDVKWIFSSFYTKVRSLSVPIERQFLARQEQDAILAHYSEIRKAYTKSAIGSIMARNGSHNIGSHVLSALSHNVGTMPDDRMLYQYIQHRMDYIASATMGAPDWSVPTPFVGNLMKMFYSQHHLLEHIAESDGLHSYQYQGKGTQIGNGQKDCVKIVVRRISHTPKDGWNHAKVFGKDVWMYNFFHEGVAKEGKTDSNGERIMPDVTDKPVAWKNDEDVSVPGGILGQHAFYNIVENVIRNAAKHSWAGKSEDERGAQNLEIYVDFEKDLDDETMCFTVGDNMSRLLCEDFWNDAFNYLASSENSIELPPGFSSWPEVFALPLDGFIVPSNAEVSNRQKVQDYLDGKGNLDDLPSQYKALCDYVVKKWDDLKSKESFKAILKGNPDKNEDNGEIDGLGHRLPLPLHHRQELSLAEPFINLETNQLRQSAWGLSEMKISAGYLRRANVSVIGGLESLKSEQGKAPHPLIAPIGIPSGGNGGELLWKDLCLAYRFWIALPKDVLIVADHEDKWKRFSGAGWEGIGVISYETVFGKDETKGDIGLMSDYGFVIVDHDKKLEPYNQLKLPFRSLIVVDYEQSAEGMPYVLRSELNDTSQREFVSCVYKAWLNYLKRRRGPKNIPNPDKELTIRLNIFEKKGAEKGLITDKDIYKVLFRECLHSVLEAITVDMSIGQLQRKALLMVSLYPLDEDDDLFKGSAEMFTGNHRLNIENLLRKIAANVRNYLTSSPCSSEGDGNCSKWRRLTEAYRVGLKRAAETMKYPKIAKDLLNDLDTQPCNSARSCDSALLRELDAMAEESSESGVIEAAVQALDVARTTSDVFLRKYEERIVTLPPQYKGSVKSNDKPLDFSRFGVQIAFEGDADISYNRHSTDDAPLYSEPLSGSQSYLNALANLSGQDDQWAMRLAENGLLRIVVIDERVRAFVVEHEEIRKTYESMHIAVVDTEKKPSFKPDGTSLPEFNGDAWNYVAGGCGDPHFDPDFDLVVIHQGIIDKWWSDHSQNAVKGILGKLRTRNGSPNGRFVVVTTGRGRPDNIPETAKVLAFSSIETFLFKRYPEKLNFVNSLMSILPGSTERNGDND